MSTISIDDVKRDPLGCLRRVEAGETLVVLRDKRPVAEIKPVLAPANSGRPALNLAPDAIQSMRLVETSGALDFWNHAEEDVYSNEDGEPI